MGCKLRRFFYILIIIPTFIMLLSGCNERSERKVTPEQLSNIRINNSDDINSSKMIEYSLDELNNFFGEYSAQELSTFNICGNQKDLSIESVNKIFPIQILRHNENSYYSVYRVSNGGFYYVFWSQNDKGVSVSDTFYINKLKNKNDFSSLQIGKSSYADVYKIDPSSELILLLSNGVYSYSLLDNKKLLEIQYTFNDINDRDDLIINSINIVSAKHQYGSILQSILKKDLP